MPQNPTPTFEELMQKTDGNLVEALALDITHKIEANPKNKLPKPFQQFVFSIYESLFITAADNTLGKHEDLKIATENCENEDKFLEMFTNWMDEKDEIAETFSEELAKQYEILCAKYSIKSILKEIKK